MNTNRPLTATIAIVLLTLMSVTGLILPLLSLLFSLTNPPPPPLIVRVDQILVMGVGGLIAVFGLWKLKRWGLVLTSIIAALSLLVAVYGLLVAPTEGKWPPGVLFVLNALVLVLVALPATRRAYAAAPAPGAQT